MSWILQSVTIPTALGWCSLGVRLGNWLTVEQGRRLAHWISSQLRTLLTLIACWSCNCSSLSACTVKMPSIAQVIVLFRLPEVSKPLSLPEARPGGPFAVL